MPGIVGIISSNPHQGDVERELLAMLGCMQHEQFYRSGFYSASELRACVGWVTHENAPLSCNPILDASGETALILSGDLFPSSHSDAWSPVARTDGLLARYEASGHKFLLDLNGWFAGVLVDRRRGLVTVFNDRYGVNRLYCAQREDSFVFASEAKSVLAVCPECRRLDPRALGQFLTFGSVFGGLTLFSDVFLLPGGSAWSFHGSPRPRKHSYFSMEVWEEQSTHTPDDYRETLVSTIRRIVPEYCRSDAGVGISLTGGLDTRIIMAALPPDLGPVPCYTYGGVYRDCFDVHTAAEVAAISGQGYHVISLGEDFFADFSRLAERTVWLTDGTLDICGSTELYFSSRARQIAPIRLTGNYGSEILRAASTFKPSEPSEDLVAGDLRPYIREAVVSHESLKAGHPVSYAAMKEIPWHLYGRLAVAQSQLIVRTPYMDNDLVGLAYRAPAGLRSGGRLWLGLVAELDSRLATVRTDMGLTAGGTDLQSYLRRVTRYASFKAEWYYNLGMPAWLARWDRMLRPFEPLFLGSHKIDHFRVWFRDRLSEYVRDTLASPSLAARSYVNLGYLRSRAGTGTLSGQDALDIGRVITLELVQQLYLGSTSKVARSAATDAVV